MAGFFPGLSDKGQVAGVQGPHGGNKANGIAFLFLNAQEVVEGGRIFEYDHEVQ